MVTATESTDRAGVRLDARTGLHNSGGRVEYESCVPVLSRGRDDEIALERDGRDRNDPVAAHRGVAGGVHEEDAGVSVRRDRQREQRSGHVCVSARLEHNAPPVFIRMARAPLALIRRRLSVRPRHSLHHEPQRLSADVGIDGPNHTNHQERFSWIRSTRLDRGQVIRR